VAISQVRGELIAQGLVRAKADPADKRRQLLALSAKGRRYAESLGPLWRAIGHATEGLLAAAAPSLLAALGNVEAALDCRSMLERISFKPVRGRHALER
jgi:DNA-binding MarR family transcriptional regulator